MTNEEARLQTTESIIPTEEDADWPSHLLESYAHCDEQTSLRLSEKNIIELECLSALSPLDMLNLWNGSHDATGHKVWMGALLFIEAMLVARPLLPKQVLQWRDKLFVNKRLLELGCGTGVAGISLLQMGYPSQVVFTDADTAVLDLCRRNCERNLSSKDDDNDEAGDYYEIESLMWGAESIMRSSNKEEESLFDTVIATDVLYDIASLTPLLTSVSAFLRQGGYFVLSHVPRASLDDDIGVVVASGARLEQVIEMEARDRHQLRQVDVIRPESLSMVFDGKCLNQQIIPFQDLVESDAAILIFQKEQAK